jgi:predicted RNA-binding protein YlxR (DUF448 family)
MTKVKGPRQKHVPLRTCIACRQTNAKRELIRVVRAPDARVQLDPKGKLAGRGAYLCRDRKCWEQALRSRKLDMALRTILTDEDVAALRTFAATLPEETIEKAEADVQARVGLEAARSG